MAKQNTPTGGVDQTAHQPQPSAPQTLQQVGTTKMTPTPPDQIPTRKIYLDRNFTYQGKLYGPGMVEVPELLDVQNPYGPGITELHPADDLERAQARAIDMDLSDGRIRPPVEGMDMDVTRDPMSDDQVIMRKMRAGERLTPEEVQRAQAASSVAGPASFTDGSITTVTKNTHTGIPHVRGFQFGRLEHKSEKQASPGTREALAGGGPPPSPQPGPPLTISEQAQQRER